MKHFLIAIGMLMASGPMVSAQLNRVDKMRKAMDFQDKDTVAWLYTGVAQLGFNQGFLHNWSAGGEIASLAVDGLFNASLTRLYHSQVWATNLDCAYSLFYAYSNHFVPRKVNDRIDLTSKYGSRLLPKKPIYITGLFNVNTQFTEGYDYTLPDWSTIPTSRFMSPGYFTLAAGLEYRGDGVLSVFLSPAALRLTVADKQFTSRVPEGAFGIEYGKQSRLEMGAYFTARYTKNLSKRVALKTRLDLYSNYLAKNKKDSLGNVIVHDNPGNIDVFWDNLVSIKLSKYFNLNFVLTTTYDNDIPYSDSYLDPTSGMMVKKEEPGTGLGWWQIKEVMSFGVSYKIH